MADGKQDDGADSRDSRVLSREEAKRKREELLARAAELSRPGDPAEGGNDAADASMATLILPGG